MATKIQSAYVLIGNEKESRYGVMGRYDPKTKVLDLRIHLDAKSIKNAPMSSTGKSKLVGNTSGFTPFEFNGDQKLNLNVCATIRT